MNTFEEEGGDGEHSAGTSKRVENRVTNAERQRCQEVSMQGDRCLEQSGKCKQMYLNVIVNVNVNVNVNELRLGFSNTTRSPEGILSHNNRNS